MKLMRQVDVLHSASVRRYEGLTAFFGFIIVCSPTDAVSPHRRHQAALVRRVRIRSSNDVLFVERAVVRTKADFLSFARE
jgi:hypothetical protein